MNELNTAMRKMAQIELEFNQLVEDIQVLSERLSLVKTMVDDVLSDLTESC